MTRRLLPLLILVGCASSPTPEPPPSATLAPLTGWFLAGPGQSDFRAGADASVKHGGGASGRLEAVGPATAGSATLMQSMTAEAYRGKRVRFSAFVRTRDLAADAWTGLWMRIERTEGRVAFDNMQARPIRGATEWTRREIVLDVGRDATSIDFGIVQDGTGTSWIDDASFETVSTTTPTTDLDPRPRELVNAGLESADELEGWHLTGWSAPDFVIALDRAEHHRGGASVRIANQIDAPRGRAGVVQHVLADAWHDKRVRISGAVKGTGNFYVSTLPFDAPRGHQGLTRGGCKTENATEWKACSVVVDVPAATDALEIGLWTGGKNTAWLDDVAIAIVSPDTPLTEVDERPRKFLNGDFEGPGDKVTGWIISGGAPSHYAAAIDRTERHGGASSVRFSNAIATPNGYGTLMQGFVAHAMRGKRLRMTSFVKGKGIDARGDVWLRVQGERSPGDGPGLGGGYCPLSGDFAWRPCTMVFDVPDDGDSIEIGVGLAGHGTIWFDDARFEEVDLTVPITEPRTPREIENGGFEGALPKTWFVSGGARADFEAAIDPSEHASGASSIRLRPKPDKTEPPKGYGTWMTSIDAAGYRGKRMRLSAKSKGAGISGRGDLWLRVQAQTSPGDGPGLGGGICKVHGTYDWAPCTIVFDVPKAGDTIQFGGGLGGPGTLWLDDVQLEEVSTSTPTTTRVTSPPTSPLNLSFEP